MTKINIEDIKIDRGTYPRTNPNWIVSYRYKNAMEAGAKFPPIVVANFKNKYYLVDGYHRLHAYKSLNKKIIDAEIISGVSKKQIYVEAVRRNTVHGYQFNAGDTTNIIIQLRKHNLSKQKISSLINMPVNKIDPYMVKHTAYVSKDSTTRLTFIKKPFKHMAGEIISDVQDSEQEMFSGGVDQNHLILQIISLFENKLIDVGNKDVQESIERLYNILKGIMIKEEQK